MVIPDGKSWSKVINNYICLRPTEHLFMILKVDSEIELRTLQRSHAAVIFKTIDQERGYLGKWLPFVAQTKTIDDVLEFIDHVTNLPKERLDYPFAIEKNGTLVGLIHIKESDVLNRKTEIGYWLSEKYQKQGIMTKSLGKVCDFAFHELDLNRVQLKCGVGNTASSNIPKKLGFTLEGIERYGELMSDNTFIDLEIYSKLQSDH